MAKLSTLADDPRWLAREFTRIINQKRTGAPYYSDGVDIFEEDWDNLVILDACRYDFFQDSCEIEGKLERRMSRGATSSEFIRGNFTGRSLMDTVYVSANGHFSILFDELSCDIFQYVPLHDEEYRDAADGLTTSPGTVTDHAISAAKNHPNKRLIVHYLQPHQPYLGEWAQSHIEHGHDLPNTVSQSGVDSETIERAYRENLDLVLEEVGRLLDELQGRTVVTADHGEFLGERQPYIPVEDYGHHEGVYCTELLEVPWLIVENGQRKEITEESNSSIDLGNDVQSHLQDLGYMH